MKLLTILFATLFIFMSCVAEAKGARSRSRSHNVSHSQSKTQRTRDSSGRFVSSPKAPGSKKVDPEASGGGMAQTVVGSMVGATIGAVAGNALSNAFGTPEDSDEGYDLADDEFTCQEKEVM